MIASASYDIKWGKFTTTKLSAFYEGYNIGFISNYSYSRVYYLMNSISGISSANQLIYIPTKNDMASMTFVSEENKAAFNNFIENDRYLSRHRGEYAERNGVLAPWLNRINVHVSREITLNVNGKNHSLEIAADVKNVANLLNNHWGLYKTISSNVILNYDKSSQTYTFTKPTWTNYANMASTWSAALSFRYKF